MSPQRGKLVPFSRRADLGLGTWKGYLYRDVEVYTPEEFESYFIKQWHANQ